MVRKGWVKNVGRYLGHAGWVRSEKRENRHEAGKG